MGSLSGRLYFQRCPSPTALFWEQRSCRALDSQILFTPSTKDISSGIPRYCFKNTMTVFLVSHSPSNRADNAIGIQSLCSSWFQSTAGNSLCSRAKFRTLLFSTICCIFPMLLIVFVPVCSLWNVSRCPLFLGLLHGRSSVAVLIYLHHYCIPLNFS